MDETKTGSVLTYISSRQSHFTARTWKGSKILSLYTERALGQCSTQTKLHTRITAKPAIVEHTYTVQHTRSWSSHKLQGTRKDKSKKGENPRRVVPHPRVYVMWARGRKRQSNRRKGILKKLQIFLLAWRTSKWNTKIDVRSFIESYIIQESLNTTSI